MNARLIPEGGENPYADHPGFANQGCELQYTVTPFKLGSTSMHGFGCSATGGHCVKGEYCDSRKESAAKRVKRISLTSIFMLTEVLTGLTEEDLLAEATAETPEDQADAHLNNVIKMVEFQQGKND